MQKIVSDVEEKKGIEQNAAEEEMTQVEAEKQGMKSAAFQRLGLTKRETEIATLISLGYSNREIAEELIISETTVKKHVSNIFEKTGIERRDELKNI